MSISDHYDGQRFFNPEYPARAHGGFLKLIKFFAKYAKRKSWQQQDPNNIAPDIQKNLKPDQAAVTFINHASFLIQLPNLNILTDPVWSRRASPFSWIGPKRVREPGIELDVLPEINLVIVSHNHYDHMDISTLRKLKEKFSPLFIVPIGLKKLLTGRGIDKVHEMDWWDKLELQEKVIVTLTPAQHFSSRNLFDRNRSLWGSYMIQHGKNRIFFGGDTGYANHFKKIREKFGEPDIAFLPIGAWETEEFMKPIHMTSRDAVRAHLGLGSKKSFAMHFGTFQMSTNRAINQAAIDLEHALDEFGVDRTEFELPIEGRTSIINLDQ